MRGETECWGCGAPLERGDDAGVCAACRAQPPARGAVGAVTMPLPGWQVEDTAAE